MDYQMKEGLLLQAVSGAVSIMYKEGRSRSKPKNSRSVVTRSNALAGEHGACQCWHLPGAPVRGRDRAWREVVRATRRRHFYRGWDSEPGKELF